MYSCIYLYYKRKKISLIEILVCCMNSSNICNMTNMCELLYAASSPLFPKMLQAEEVVASTLAYLLKLNTAIFTIAALECYG